MLDIGCGPGYLAVSVGAAMGLKGQVEGSESMLALARSRFAEQPWVTFDIVEDTALPFREKSFDVAISSQVREYVAEIDTGLAQINRVLRPGGREIIVSTDWGSQVWHSGDTA